MNLMTLDIIFGSFVWAFVGVFIYGLMFESVKRLPQRIFLASVCGPFVWIGWLIRWFFMWLFAK